MGASLGGLLCCFDDCRGGAVCLRKIYFFFFKHGSSSLQRCSRSPERQYVESVCELCRASLDPALLEGHKEVCRLNRMRMAKRATDTHAEILPASDDESEGFCLVCCAAKLKYAFLPCGHLACCDTCVKVLDKCPVCRGPRDGLCIVSNETLLQFRCPYCGLIISPVLYDGHREVCAVLHLKHVGVEEQDDGSLPKTDSINVDSIISEAISACCLECRSAEAPLVVARPCGHRAICTRCASGRTTCPVCLQNVHDFCRLYV